MCFSILIKHKTKFWMIFNSLFFYEDVETLNCSDESYYYAQEECQWEGSCGGSRITAVLKKICTAITFPGFLELKNLIIFMYTCEVFSGLSMSCSRSCPLVDCVNMELLLTNSLARLIYMAKVCQPTADIILEDGVRDDIHIMQCVLLILMTENTAINHRLSKLCKSKGSCRDTPSIFRLS